MRLGITDKNGKALYSDSIVYWGDSLSHFETRDGEVVLSFNPFRDNAFYFISLEECKREYSNLENKLKLVKDHATMNEYDEIMKDRYLKGELD